MSLVTVDELNSMDLENTHDLLIATDKIFTSQQCTSNGKRTHFLSTFSKVSMIGILGFTMWLFP